MIYQKEKVGEKSRERLEFIERYLEDYCNCTNYRQSSFIEDTKVYTSYINNLSNHFRRAVYA